MFMILEGNARLHFPAVAFYKLFKEFPSFFFPIIIYLIYSECSMKVIGDAFSRTLYAEKNSFEFSHNYHQTRVLEIGEMKDNASTKSEKSKKEMIIEQKLSTRLYNSSLARKCWQYVHCHS